jgi:predicted ATPase
MDPRLLNRIRLRNYKSIAASDVELGALSFLVGPNGSGKSNFLDALHFVADGLRHSLDHALRDRGGINEVRRRSGGHPNHFGLRLDLSLEGATGYYAFRIGSERDGAYVVQREECRISPHDHLGLRIGYQVEAGDVIEFTPGNAPPAARDGVCVVPMR